MSITEKKLAEALEGFDHEELDYQQIARRAAKLLGVTLAPEKPEPGTWHLTRSEGWPAYVDTDGHLFIIGPNGYLDMYMSGTKDWPALTPARVVPEAEWQEWQSIPKWERDLLLKSERPVFPAEPPVLTESKVGEWWDLCSWAKDRPWSSLSRGDRIAVLGMAKLGANYGGARELPGRDEVRDGLYRKLGSWLGDRDRRAVEEAVMELLGGGGDE